jgi:nucleotide-binding universal stress UspA family protein
MFRRILVPIDGSHTSNVGLEEAIKMAMDQDATLCLLHVVDELSVTQNLGGARHAPASYVDEFLNALREGGEKVLAKAEATVRTHGIKTDTVLVETVGHRVAEVIIRQAKRWRADLIVLGTHGRRGLTRLVMGSDAEGVVRSTTVPVLLVRSPDLARPRSTRKIKPLASTGKGGRLVANRS